ncbi:MAG: molybdenum cofactor biosynthesis protein D/E [Candidatus Poribacteria bacterium]|nr:MAG: molybdenum cofactor biosynthesis protein D/E [Candidatus Poribacteria bacterium]
MEITVRFFAGCREVVGSDAVALQVPQGATVADLERLLIAHYPQLKPYAGRVRYAVNWDYVSEGRLLQEGDEVAMIPPVAGGAGPVWAWITADPIEEATVRPLVETPEAGAIVLFLGVVRNHAEGRPVVGLEYEAYVPMAERVLRSLAEETLSRWSLQRVAVVHRVGRLKIGEVSIAIAVSAAHRREAFAACAYLMDRIKEEVPIWKREHWAEGGARWVGDPTEQMPDEKGEEQCP